MDTILETYATSLFNYVKEHIKEIHLYSIDVEYQKSERAYLLLDDDSIITACDHKQANLYLYNYLGTKSSKYFSKNLACSYPELSIRDLSDNIINHGLVKEGTPILETEAWSLDAQ